MGESFGLNNAPRMSNDDPAKSSKKTGPADGGEDEKLVWKVLSARRMSLFAGLNSPRIWPMLTGGRTNNASSCNADAKAMKI